MSKSRNAETKEPVDANEAVKNVTDKTIDLDYVLVNELGQFGRFQSRKVLLVLIPIIMSGFFNEYVFSAAAIPHRCRIPECGESGPGEIFQPEWISNAIPETENGFSSCQRFSALEINGSLDNCPAEVFTTGVIACDDYVYERNNSVVYDFDLGCQEWMRALAGTLNSVGTLLVLPLTGYFSDRYGRRLSLVVNTFNIALFGVLRAFSTNYTMYLALQLVQTTLGGGTFSTAFIFATELVGPKYRALMSAILPSMLSVGLIILGGVAWAVQSWRHMILIIHVPCFAVISYYWFMGESVRWLLSKQKFTEAKTILDEVARVNGTKISDKSMEALLNPPKNKRPASNVTELIKYVCRSAILLRRVCTTPFLWMATLFVYYGLFINSTSLSSTPHLDFILTSAVDIPGNITGLVFMNRFGRRKTLCVGFSMNMACGIVFAVLPNELDVFRLVMYLLSKFGIAMVLSGIYLYTSELYPTEHRHSLLAFSSMIGRIGSIIASLTPPLLEYWEGLPSVIFAFASMLAALLLFTLPETRGTKLPDTLAEAEALENPASRNCNYN